MKEFSLERLSEKINYGKTKIYFQEVLSSYHNKNYRSSVVMLWSVAVCDIVYKLQNLIDLYNDAAAKEILEEMTSKQEANPKSSVWELDLLDDVYKKTQLLDTSEYENLRYLQKQRHLSAHPVLNSERELHSPRKETVRSLLRTTLEELLIKPPFYTQRITSEILAEVAESAEVLNTYEKTKKFVVSRYFERTTPSVELNILRSFWKLVFKLENEDCNKSRVVNYRVVRVLASRNSARLAENIAGDKDYYNNIASSGMPAAFFVHFLSLYPAIYEQLNEDAKLKVNHCIENNPSAKIMGWFIKDSLTTHGKDIKEWILSDTPPRLTLDQLDAILDISDSEEWESIFCTIATDYYTTSFSYDQADSRFQIAIPKYIKYFGRNELEYLAEKINSNSQCWGRGKSLEDYKVIKSRIDAVFNDEFDYSEVPHFRDKVLAEDRS